MSSIMSSRLMVIRGFISPALQTGRFSFLTPSSVCLSCRNETFSRNEVKFDLVRSNYATFSVLTRSFSSKVAPKHDIKTARKERKEEERRLMRLAVDDLEQERKLKEAAHQQRLAREALRNLPPIEEVLASDPALQSPDYFQVRSIFTVRDLFDARVHLGHKVGSLNHRMNDFVFGSRFDSVIFDLDKTAFHLRQALNFIAHIAYRQGIIMFVTRAPHTMHLVEKTAIECGEYAHCREWHTHIMTNSENKFGGITRLPDLIIMISTLDSVLAPHGAIQDANKMLIPTVAVCDSNCDPSLITYPVPGNDDTLSSVQFFCKVFKEAIVRGKQKRKSEESQIKNETAKVGEK